MEDVAVVVRNAYDVKSGNTKRLLIRILLLVAVATSVGSAGQQMGLDERTDVDSHGIDDEEESLLDDLYFGLYRGQVIDNKDPDGLGRVTVRVESLIEESEWAWQCGAPGGGGKNKGYFFVPPIGAEIVVGFEEGDVDSPYYFSFHYGEGEINTNFGYNGSGQWNQGMETDIWLVEYDDRKESPKFKLTHKGSGANLLLNVTTTGVQTVMESTKTHLKSPLTELSDTTTDQIIKGNTFIQSFATYLTAVSTAYSTWQAAGIPTPATNGVFIASFGLATVNIIKDVGTWLSSKVRTG